jgi:hypothetical protein
MNLNRNIVTKRINLLQVANQLRALHQRFSASWTLGQAVRSRAKFGQAGIAISGQQVRHQTHFGTL